MASSRSDLDRKALQEELLDLFAKYDVSMGVGLTQTGFSPFPK